MFLNTVRNMYHKRLLLFSMIIRKHLCVAYVTKDKNPEYVNNLILYSNIYQLLYILFLHTIPPYTHELTVVNDIREMVAHVFFIYLEALTHKKFTLIPRNLQTPVFCNYAMLKSERLWRNTINFLFYSVIIFHLSSFQSCFIIEKSRTLNIPWRSGEWLCDTLGINVTVIHYSPKRTPPS